MLNAYSLLSTLSNTLSSIQTTVDAEVIVLPVDELWGVTERVVNQQCVTGPFAQPHVRRDVRGMRQKKEQQHGEGERDAHWLYVQPVHGKRHLVCNPQSIHTSAILKMQEYN